MNSLLFSHKQNQKEIKSSLIKAWFLINVGVVGVSLFLAVCIAFNKEELKITFTTLL